MLQQQARRVPGENDFVELRHPWGRGVSVTRPLRERGPLMAEQDRVVEVEWSPTAWSLFLPPSKSRSAHAPVASDVTRFLSDAHVSILSATVTTPRLATSSRCPGSPSRWATPKHLGHLLAQVRTVEGVYSAAYRVTS